MDDEPLAGNDVAFRYLYRGKPLAREADHGAAGLADEVRMVPGAPRLVGVMRAVTPDTVGSRHRVHEPRSAKRIEGPVYGNAVDIVEPRESGDVGVGNGLSALNQPLQDPDSYAVTAGRSDG